MAWGSGLNFLTYILSDQYPANLTVHLGDLTFPVLLGQL